MTTLQIFENVSQVFPKILETQILIDLDDAQKLFAEETGLLEERGQLSSISTSVAWSLPTKFRSLTDLVFYDSDGKPLYIGKYNYGYEIEFGKFYIYSKNSTPVTGLNTAIDTAYIHYKKIPATLTTRNISLEIEEEFTKALEHYLLADYFSKYPTLEGGIRDLRSASWHLKRYEEIKIKAKRYVNGKEPIGKVQNYQHAGAQVLPRRVDDGVLGSTSVTQVVALTQLYTKYIRFTLDTADGDGVKTPTTTAIGYSTVTGTVATNTFTLASTAEFEKDTQIIINDSAVSWVWNSSSEIVVSLGAGWAVIELEIYER